MLQSPLLPVGVDAHAGPQAGHRLDRIGADLEGAQVEVLILANGLTSRRDFDAASAVDKLHIHHQRAQRAGQFLGANRVTLAGLPDQKMDTVPLLEIIQIIERELDRLRPTQVFTQHGGDLNMDHAITFRATLTATRPTPDCTVKRLYAYEVGSSTEWSFQQFEPRFQPQVFVDIGPFLESKLESMLMYESEVRAFPHPRSPEAIRATALRWGCVSGLAAAEAFQLVREIH